MWTAGEEDFGLDTMQDTEIGKLIRGANHKVEHHHHDQNSNDVDCCQQETAQYGRLQPVGAETLFLARFLNLSRREGIRRGGRDTPRRDNPGIARLLLQAAYTIGCRVRGIVTQCCRGQEYHRNLQNGNTGTCRNNNCPTATITIKVGQAGR
jgi:hypothetical protein